MRKRKHEVLGKRFGKLFVLSEDSSDGVRRAHVVCDCGGSKKVAVGNLVKGTTTSCGCVHLDKVTKHGLSQTRLYKIWAGMHERCNNPMHEAYQRYGGRGIAVDPSWETVEAFIEWSKVSGYSPELTLDRICNENNYRPDNCRWATRTTQQRNRRPNVKGSSSFIGVSFTANTGKWKSGVKVDGKQIHLGYFKTEVEAAIARDRYIIDQKLTDFTLNGVINKELT